MPNVEVSDQEDTYSNGERNHFRLSLSRSFSTSGKLNGGGRAVDHQRDHKSEGGRADGVGNPTPERAQDTFGNGCRLSQRCKPRSNLLRAVEFDPPIELPEIVARVPCPIHSGERCCLTLWHQFEFALEATIAQETCDRI